MGQRVVQRACSFWKEKPGKPVHVTGKRVRSHVLMVNQTLDAATPYSGALEVRKLFPRSSLIEGGGGNHARRVAQWDRLH